MRGAVRLHLLALFVGVLPVLAIALVGCGGGGSTTVTQTETVVETETAPAAGESTSPSTEGPSTGSEGASEGETESGAKPGAEGGAEAPLHLKTFQSPSGNIGCALYGGGARCDIDKHSWTPPPRPASCSNQVDYGQGLQVSRGGRASVVCAGDTVMEPKAPQLAYGSASEVGGTTCVSREAGVTCTNGAGHGFFVSVQRYRFF